MTEQPAYDASAERYGASKWLLFRHFIERYTLFEVLGGGAGRYWTWRAAKESTRASSSGRARWR